MALIYQEKSFKNVILKHEVFQTLFLKLLKNTKIKKKRSFFPNLLSNFKFKLKFILCFDKLYLRH